MRALLRFTLVVLFTVLASGCASAPEAGSAPATPATAAGEVTLRVHNTDAAGQPLTIYLVPIAGQLVRLGTVESNAYLTVPHRAGTGRFQLRAERPDGTTVTSPAFDIVSGTYTWDMALRRVDRAR
jgi:hypothetical protein